MRFFNKTNSDIYNHAMIFFGVFSIILATGVLFSQIGLRIDKTRNMLTSVDILDGTVAAGSDFIPDIGEITLKMVDGKPSENVSILVNGNEIEKFDSTSKTITITNQSVVEISNTSRLPVKIELASVSQNLDTVLNNEVVEVTGCKVLCRVIFQK